MNHKAKVILINIGAFAALCVVLLVGVNAWLRVYTHHNQALRVPDVCDLTVGEAAASLSERGLRFSVIDSIRNSSKPAGVVLEQKPAPNAKVKTNRIIYLTTNAHEEVCAVVPYVKDYSQRQATATLEALGFKVEKVTLVPSEYRNLVIDILYQGESIEPNTTMPIGSGFTLVVGRGRSTDRTIIPPFIGMSLDSAILLAHQSSLNIGNVSYDVKPANNQEAAGYFVYQQSPLPGEVETLGKRIDLWMTTDTMLLYPDRLVEEPAETESDSDTQALW